MVDRLYRNFIQNNSLGIDSSVGQLVSLQQAQLEILSDFRSVEDGWMGLKLDALDSCCTNIEYRVKMFITSTSQYAVQLVRKKLKVQELE